MSVYLVLWIVISISAILVDIITSTFLFVWFTIGGIASLILALRGYSFSIQILCFTGVSAICMAIGYPIVKKTIKKTVPITNTMEKDYIGNQFIIEKDVEDKAIIKYNGIYWTVKVTDEYVKKGSKVQVVGIEGNKLLIKKCKERGNIMFIVAIVFFVIILAALLYSIKIVNTGYLYIVERFGQYHRTLEPGWHFTIPFADFVRKKISTKQQILDIQPQNVITRDNVKISIDNVIFYKILNAKDAVYNIEDFKSGIIYSTITNMRNIVGEMTLDEVLSGRDRINSKLLEIIDDITDAYGIKILSVEIKNIVPPAEIQQAMEKQMKAERDKRAAILQAEGLKQSEIARAEGEKQSKILQAEAEKEANIRHAEGLRESQLLEAEGKAKAIAIVSQAEADAINKVNKAIIESGTNETVIALKQVEALKEMANSPANKLILPNETLSSLGSIAAIGEMLKKDDK